MLWPIKKSFKAFRSFIFDANILQWSGLFVERIRPIIGTLNFVRNQVSGSYDDVMDVFSLLIYLSAYKVVWVKFLTIKRFPYFHNPGKIKLHKLIYTDNFQFCYLNLRWWVILILCVLNSWPFELLQKPTLYLSVESWILTLNVIQG